MLAPPHTEDLPLNSWKTNRVVQSLILVTGGVVGGIGHEIVGRPFDAARHVFHVNETHVRTEHIKAMSSHSEIPNLLRHQSFWSKVVTSIDVLRSTIREEGWLYFVRSTTPTSFDTKSSPSQRLHAALRTLGRVGPWGVAFVVWEATGGINV